MARKPRVPRLGRESRDCVLRAAGFKIAGRPKKGEPVWVRDGTKHPESVAWKLIMQEAGRE